MLWGGWLIVTVLVISLAKGIIHPYYSVAAAPAIGAMVGHRCVGAVGDAIDARRPRSPWRPHWRPRRCGPMSLLDRAPRGCRGCASPCSALALGAALLLVLGPRLRGRARSRSARSPSARALAGPAAYAVDTAATAARRRHPLGRARPRARDPAVGRAAAGGSRAVGGAARSGRDRRPGGAGRGFPGRAPGSRPGPEPAHRPPEAPHHAARSRRWLQWPAAGTDGGTAGARSGRWRRRRGRVPLDQHAGSKLVKALEADAGDYKWVAATVNSNSAAGYQLATDDPVMAIGGFNGTDPGPDPRAVRARRRRDEDPLLHRRRRTRARYRDLGHHRRADHAVGREPLHRRDAQRRHGLRPVESETDRGHGSGPRR